MPEAQYSEDRTMTSPFERYLTLWVGLCILAGILLGRIAPGLAQALDRMAISVNGAPVVSTPIAVCLFFMMYPIMVKIDFNAVVRAGRSGKPVFLTLFLNWCIKPFTMYGIAMVFLGLLFKGFIGTDATDLVKLPFGLDLPVGAVHGAGTVVMAEGIKLLEIPLWRSYLAGCILLGIAPCTAMVLVWGYLARPLTILWIAVPLFIQTVLIFGMGYGAARMMKLSYEDAAPAAMIGASNHFEVAIATAVMLFGLSSGAALATVVGVLIEVPVMLMLVEICKKTRHWFEDGNTKTG